MKDSVIIEVKGGVVQAVRATTDLRVIVVDHDHVMADESDNIVELAKEIATGQMLDDIVPRDTVDRTVLEMVSPQKVCSLCGRGFRDASEKTSIDDHGKCRTCHREELHNTSPGDNLQFVYLDGRGACCALTFANPGNVSAEEASWQIINACYDKDKFNSTKSRLLDFSAAYTSGVSASGIADPCTFLYIEKTDDEISDPRSIGKFIEAFQAAAKDGWGVQELSTI